MEKAVAAFVAATAFLNDARYKRGAAYVVYGTIIFRHKRCYQEGRSIIRASTLFLVKSCGLYFLCTHENLYQFLRL